MKNITLKIDDETYRKARIRAASEGTSVSAMVRDFLIREVAEQEDRETRRVKALEELYCIAGTRGVKKSKAIKPMTREEIYAQRIR